MRVALREAIRELYGRRCGYCGTSEDEIGARLTIDHFQPRVRGGRDEEDNLVYCCHACNEFKGDWWSEENPRLLHPRNDDLSIHFIETIQHILVPLTDQGRQYIEVLNLNRPEVIAHRRRNFREAERESGIGELLRRFDTLEMEIRRLRESIE